ncbi:hypothetical protein Misp01_11380 [Microtetraspora sp. NBRC 13810]|nr:hypothetical protein Misp01_11380 [Microtetraspora sp. NBRC 13810]
MVYGVLLTHMASHFLPETYAPVLGISSSFDRKNFGQTIKNYTWRDRSDKRVLHHIAESRFSAMLDTPTGVHSQETCAEAARKLDNLSLFASGKHPDRKRKAHRSGLGLEGYVTAPGC